MRWLDFTRKSLPVFFQLSQLSPRTFHKEWQTLLPFWEILVKASRMVKILLKSHTRGSLPVRQHLVPWGQKAPDSTPAADPEDISEMLSTVEFVITRCFQGLRVYSVLKRSTGSPGACPLPPKVLPFPAWTRWAQALSPGLQIQLNPSLCHLPEAPTCIFYDFWHISSLSDILQCIPPPPI